MVARQENGGRRTYLIAPVSDVVVVADALPLKEGGI
jgi:hypothetical protein